MPLPLFPLRLLPMPGETIGLHIFEERYQVLFNDLEAMHVDEFGIPFVHDQKIWRVGATMRLVTVQKRHSGGKRDVAVTSTGLFRLRNMDETPGLVPYPLGEVDPIQEWTAWPLGKACAEARDTTRVPAAESVSAPLTSMVALSGSFSLEVTVRPPSSSA